MIQIAQILITKSKVNYTEIVPYGNSTFYHIGPLGSVSHHHISDDWHNVKGPWVHKYMPWLNQMLNDMKELEPTFAISIMNGTGAEHVDFDTYPTAFNYPINTTQARTYIKYEKNQYEYPSIANEPWILSTKYPHGVKNTELRFVFNLHFGVDYPTVKTWFDLHPNLIYK